LRALGITAGRGPALSHPDRIIGADRARSIDPSARLTILDSDEAPDSRIILGQDVFIGRQVELTAAGGGSVEIEADTSIQDSSIIFGNVRIGAHCLFGKYVFVASRGHCFRDRPSWLIRDQDRLMLSHPASRSALRASRVHIEDDCWIAQSVVVSPGIYIGRGAVVGANSVVTSDIAPYEIHGGTPNRKIGTRLDFVPPWAIDARDDNAIPYFYRGFKLSQDALAQSRRDGFIEARSTACIVLARGPLGRFKLCGVNAGDRDIRLAFRINGIDCGGHDAAPGGFDIAIDVPAPIDGSDSVPAVLRHSTYIEIETEEADARYGIMSAALVASS
jgi:acetyltransferase-like isoleucine patch superfamily enzyme